MTENQENGPAAPKVKDYMVKEPVTVRPDIDAHEAIGLLLQHRISGMPVVDDDGKLLGILSERDCLKTLASAQYYEMPTSRVKDLMSTDVETVDPEMDIWRMAEMFLQRKYRRFPVLKDGKLVGQISRRDVLRSIQELQ